MALLEQAAADGGLDLYEAIPAQHHRERPYGSCGTSWLLDLGFRPMPVGP
ncbi:hypothetical protein ACFYM5_35530 [Streptomyces sp. NPDC006706]